ESRRARLHSDQHPDRAAWALHQCSRRGERIRCLLSQESVVSQRRGAVRRVGPIRSRARMIQDLAVSVVFIVYAVTVLLVFGTFLTWVERKQAAIMSDRIGANRAYVRIPFTQIKLVWLGLFHGLADGLKMMLKEDFKPNSYDRFAYAIAPWVVFAPVLLVFAVIPFGGMLEPARLFPALAEWYGGRRYPLQHSR